MRYRAGRSLRGASWCRLWVVRAYFRLIALALCFGLLQSALVHLGLFYMFGLFSPTLKSEFSLTQRTLDQIATAANAGGNIGVHAGMFFDSMGPKPTILIGAVMGTLACA